MSDLLTPKQAADRLQVHVRTIRRLCHSGDLAGAFQVGRQWRIPARAVGAIRGLNDRAADGDRAAQDLLDAA